MLLEVRFIFLLEVSVESSLSCLSQKDEVPMGGNAANIVLLLESPPPSASCLCSSSSSSSLSSLLLPLLFDNIEYSRLLQ